MTTGLHKAVHLTALRQAPPNAPVLRITMQRRRTDTSLDTLLGHYLRPYLVENHLQDSKTVWGLGVSGAKMEEDTACALVDRGSGALGCLGCGRLGFGVLVFRGLGLGGGGLGFCWWIIGWF